MHIDPLPPKAVNPQSDGQTGEHRGCGTKKHQGSGVSRNPTYQHSPSNSTGRLPARYRIVSSLRDSRTVLREATWRSIFLLISMLLCSRSAFWWCHYATPTTDRNNQSAKFFRSQYRNCDIIKIAFTFWWNSVVASISFFSCSVNWEKHTKLAAHSTA